MAMFIVKPWYKKVNPDDCFDPDTHIATEENFIKFLECGVYDSKYIGYKVQLGNSVEYNNRLWVIADVNHDSANTGQTDCYDLISQDCFHSIIFGSSNTWRESSPRTWLNNSFYPGFSTDFKTHMLNPKYNSQGTWYNDDKIIIPSFIEVNGTTGTSSRDYDTEGIPYPIFTDNNSRVKNPSYNYWETRSRNTWGYASYGEVWCVRGELTLYGCNYNTYLAPILRIS